MTETLTSLVLTHFGDTDALDLTAKYDQRDGTGAKPRGLWVSDEADYGWSQWCESEGFRDTSAQTRTEFILRPEANLLHLTTTGQILALADDFPRPHEKIGPRWREYRFYIDWEAMAAEFDGILITPYSWAARTDDRSRLVLGLGLRQRMHLEPCSARGRPVSGADRLEDGFPHGTTQGYEQGCKSGWCPEGNAHGLSCKRAKQLAAGDYRYQRLVKQGLTPAEIADQLGLAPETHQAPARTPEDTEETTMRPTPEVQSRRDEIRAWAEKHGIPVNARGRFPAALVAAFDANDPKLLDGESQRAREREAQRKRRERARAAEAPEAPAPTVEPQEPETSAVEAVSAGDDMTALDGATSLPEEGVQMRTSGEFAAQWNRVDPRDRDRITEIILGWQAGAMRCRIEDHGSMPDLVEAHRAASARADAAEAALALTLRKWGEAKRLVKGHRMVSEILRIQANIDARLIERLTAEDATNQRILDDYAAEIRRNHDEIARLRAENEQLRQPWWKRAAA